MDLIAPFTRGGKVGIFGGAGVGKTVIIQELIRTFATVAPGVLGVCRRGRALARGQRPVARNDGVGRYRQGRHGLRANERTAGRALPRGADRPDDGGVFPRPGPGRAAVHRQHLPLRDGRHGSVRSDGPHAERRGLPADPGHRHGRAAGAHRQHQDGRHHLAAGGLRACRRLYRSGAGDDFRSPGRDHRSGALDRRTWVSTRRSIRWPQRRAFSIR